MNRIPTRPSAYYFDHRRRTSLLWLLMLMSAWAWAQPRITFDTTNILKGPLPHGAECVFEFGFTNTGDSALVLGQVKASGSVVPKWIMEPVPPGARGFVTAIYDSKRDGTFRRTITVPSNDPLNPAVVLTIRGEIIGPSFLDYFPQWTGNFHFMVPTESNDPPCRGSEENRPSIPALRSPRLMIVHSRNNYEYQRMDLTAYNDASGGHYGMFFCPMDSMLVMLRGKQNITLPFDPTYVAQHWGGMFSDRFELPPSGRVYIVILDVDWIRERYFSHGETEWALPIGVEAYDPVRNRSVPAQTPSR